MTITTQRMNISAAWRIIAILVMVLASFTTSVWGAGLTGKVYDSHTGEPIVGASVVIVGTTRGAFTDIDGQYMLTVPQGAYRLRFESIGYQAKECDNTAGTAAKGILDMALVEEAQQMDEVVVVGEKRLHSETALISNMRYATSVASGVSAQQIAKNHDKDASEVIRRIPGISIIDEKFIIARGLGQRYNNVWINQGATPSSEADTRSFSFDIIPSSQIENVVIVKSPVPELPADFSGGFIKIATRSIAADEATQVSLGTGFNTQTHFRNFSYNPGSPTDFLGFDGGKRQLASFVPARIDETNAQQVTRATQEGFNNDWSVKTKTPLGDIRFNVLVNKKKQVKDKSYGLLAALNYGHSYRTYNDMENNRFGIYNVEQDKPDYLYRYTDQQYSINAKLGAMLNLAYSPNKYHKLELRNMFNQLGKNRYTERQGYQFISGYYEQDKIEYLYSSRATYSGQLAGTHLFQNQDELDWVAGWSYANKRQPDRRIINLGQNGYAGDAHYGELEVDQNDISRDFTSLNEYLYSLAGNYKHTFKFSDSFTPYLKAGVYGEYKDREFTNHIYFYRWMAANMPEGFGYQAPVGGMLSPSNYGANKLYIYDDTDNRNSYAGYNKLMAAYTGLNIPLGPLSVYAGLRMEHSNMSLVSYTTIRESRTKQKDYVYTDLFPSVNASWQLTKQQMLRLGYGKSINRQEFREVASAAYYDFDLFSFVAGNPYLEPAHIQNLDLRYEIYPSGGEMISLAVFYKHFTNPIEWTYLDAGGTYTFTFENAKAAVNYGAELEVKKSLAFVGLKDFSLAFNGTVIQSNVQFEEGSLEHDRPMQGQSPYLVNAGLFYQQDKLGLNVNLLYNIIGKRIVGIGKVDVSDGSSINNDIPDMYEMPRHTFDLSVSKRWGRFEVDLAAHDLLAQKVVFKQFPKFQDVNGAIHERSQVTKSFYPGQSVTVTFRYRM